VQQVAPLQKLHLLSGVINTWPTGEMGMIEVMTALPATAKRRSLAQHARD
jgi:hypothetical protein